MVKTAPGPTGREALRRFRELGQDPLAYLSSLANQHGDLFRVPLPRGQVFVTSHPVGNQANYITGRRAAPDHGGEDLLVNPTVTLRPDGPMPMTLHPR